MSVVYIGLREKTERLPALKRKRPFARDLPNVRTNMLDYRHRGTPPPNSLLERVRMVRLWHETGELATHLDREARLQEKGAHRP